MTLKLVSGKSHQEGFSQQGRLKFQFLRDNMDARLRDWSELARISQFGPQVLGTL